MELTLDPTEIQTRQNRILQYADESTDRFQELISSTPWQIFTDIKFLETLINQVKDNNLVPLYQELESRPFKDKEFNKYIVKTNGDLTSQFLEFYIKKTNNILSDSYNSEYLDKQMWFITTIFEHPNKKLLELMISNNCSNDLIEKLLYMTTRPDCNIYNRYETQDYLLLLYNLDMFKDKTIDKQTNFIDLLRKTKVLKSSLNITDSWGRNLLHLLAPYGSNEGNDNLYQMCMRLIKLGVNLDHRALIDDQQKVVNAKMNGTLPKEYGKTPRELSPHLFE